MPLTYTYPEIADIPQEAVEDPEQLTQHLNALVDMVRKLRDETATQTITQVADDAAAYQLLSGKGVAGGYAGLITGSYLENRPPLLHVREEQMAGTAGGTFTKDAWRTRVLNTVVGSNEIAGASLASNKITLPIGVYYPKFGAPGYFCGKHRTKLYDTTSSADIIFGATLANSDGSNCHWSEGGELFTLTAEKDIELRHYCLVTNSGDGLGLAHNTGDIEHYGYVKIWKVG